MLGWLVLKGLDLKERNLPGLCCGRLGYMRASAQQLRMLYHSRNHSDCTTACSTTTTVKMKLLSLLTTGTLAATAVAQPAAPPSNRLTARDDLALEGGFVKHCCTALPHHIQGIFMGKLSGTAS